MDTLMQDPQWEALVARAAERERRMRRRIAYLTLIPAALALLLLGVTGSQVARSLTQLREVQTKLTFAQSELDQSSSQLDALNLEVAALRQDADAARRDLALVQKDLDMTNETLNAKSLQLEQQTRAAAEAAAQVKDLEAQVQQLNAQIEGLRAQLRVAQQFESFEFLGDMALTMKNMYNRYPRAAELFQRIYGLRDAVWSPEGASPQAGFNSPNFAAYVLIQERVLPENALPTTFGALQEQLNMQPFPAGGAVTLARPTAVLQPGDVLFYPEGYTLFYFRDEQERPFVIGMTPLGVLALQPDFALPLGYAALYR